MITINVNIGQWVCTVCQDAGRDHAVDEVPAGPGKSVMKCSTCGYQTDGAGGNTPAEEELF